MDVLMLTVHDWANTGWRFFKMAQMLGLDVQAFKGYPHDFYYPEQIVIHPALNGLENGLIYEVPDLMEWTERAKVVHFFTSTLIVTGTNYEEKKIVMQHGGRTYRELHKEINDTYNQFVDVSIIQMPDLSGLGCKNEQWIYYPVDTKFIKPDFKRRDPNKLVIGHFPSQGYKGTRTIVSVIDEFPQDRFIYIGIRQVSQEGIIRWYSNLQRMRECDVIIENALLDFKGLPYGEWGNTALEAAALGKIVITTCVNQDKYRAEFGELPILVANGKDELRKQIQYVLSISDKEIQALKEKHREWAETKHSLEVTSKRLWEKVYRSLL